MLEPRPVLLTVSGEIPADLGEQVDAGLRPRADYVVMGEAFDADVVDVTAALAETGRPGRLAYRVGGAGLLLAWYCFRARRRYEVIVTDGEQVGIPLALLARVFGKGTARHLMIVHILSTPNKVRVIAWLRLASMVDRYVVYSSWQRRFISDRFGVPPERVELSTFMVDTAFFDPAAVSVESERMICAAGLERRDYDTLMEAVRGLDVRVVIAAASPWSKQSDGTEGRALPPNVEIDRLNLFELRELYARSLFVVMPLLAVEFQAGITTILEAMSMQRAVVCTLTDGQTDTIVDEVTGTYVRPGDAPRLRAAIERLLDDPALAGRLGRSGREWAVREADVVRYAERLADSVTALRHPG